MQISPNSYFDEKYFVVQDWPCVHISICCWGGEGDSEDWFAELESEQEDENKECLG